MKAEFSADEISLLEMCVWDKHKYVLWNPEIYTQKFRRRMAKLHAKIEKLNFAMQDSEN